MSCSSSREQYNNDVPKKENENIICIRQKNRKDSVAIDAHQLGLYHRDNENHIYISSKRTQS